MFSYIIKEVSIAAIVKKFSKQINSSISKEQMTQFGKQLEASIKTA
jgi:hypothetical protein